MEIWKPIPGYKGYEASDLGRVRSWRGRWGRTEPRLLALRLSNGYPGVGLYKDDGVSRDARSVHSLVAQAFIGPRPEGYEVRHLNGDRTDNRLSNLAYGTPSENKLDAVSHGTHHMASRTCCAQGHPYDEDNTYIRKGGGRDCRACNRERARSRAARAATQGTP